MASRRPRRGPSPLVDGGPGEYHPQGGAGVQVLHEGADLQAREFGVPEADVPGGKTHLVNPQAVPKAPAPRPERPADAHKYHGVEPLDDGGYETPPDATEERAPRPAAAPHITDAVPVYEVERPGDERKIRKTITQLIQLPVSGSDPVRICGRDPHRSQIQLLCEVADVPVNAVAAFTAGSAGTATLPAGASLTGFTVTAASTAAAENGTVTVSNVPNGPLVYNFVMQNGGNGAPILNIDFPEPLPQVGNSPITVAISAITSGSAGNITAYGTSGNTTDGRVSQDRTQLLETVGGKPNGFRLKQAAGNAVRFVTQDELFGVSDSATATSLVSVAIETMVYETEP